MGPAAFAWGYRFAGDVRDSQRKERAKLYSGDHGVWDCTRCMYCNERCPKGVDPRDAIEKLGGVAFAEGVTRDKGARHAKAFLISMRTGGKLNETLLVPVHRPDRRAAGHRPSRSRCCATARRRRRSPTASRS